MISKEKKKIEKRGKREKIKTLKREIKTLKRETARFMSYPSVRKGVELDVSPSSAKKIFHIQLKASRRYFGVLRCVFWENINLRHG